jgi:hypothetical protein
MQLTQFTYRYNVYVYVYVHAKISRCSQYLATPRLASLANFRFQDVIHDNSHTSMMLTCKQYLYHGRMRTHLSSQFHPCAGGVYGAGIDGAWVDDWPTTLSAGPCHCQISFGYLGNKQ